MLAKDFDTWNNKEKTLDSRDYDPPLFKEREIWRSSYGPNVGLEVCGRGSEFRRPVLIITKLSQRSFIGVPLSTQHNEGTWYATITHSEGVRNTANLAQIRYFDYRRLDKRLATLDTADFSRVKTHLRSLLSLET